MAVELGSHRMLQRLEADAARIDKRVEASPPAATEASARGPESPTRASGPKKRVKGAGRGAARKGGKGSGKRAARAKAPRKSGGSTSGGAGGPARSPSRVQQGLAAVTSPGKSTRASRLRGYGSTFEDESSLTPEQRLERKRRIRRGESLRYSKVPRAAAATEASRVAHEDSEGLLRRLGESAKTLRERDALQGSWAMRLLTWGSGGDGQLCTGEERTLFLPCQATGLEDGTNTTPGVVHPNLPTDVAAGGAFTVVVTHAGDVLTCGTGYLGRGKERQCTLAKQVPTLRGKFVTSCAAGENHTAVLTDLGELLTWGEGEDGRLGHGDTSARDKPRVVVGLSTKKCVQVSLGERHTAALMQDCSVWTWGAGRAGQLGLGDFRQRLVPTKVDALDGELTDQVSCGMNHTAVVTATGKCFTWGWGESGRLGLGTEEAVNVPTVVDTGPLGRVTMVACGGMHTACVNREGEVFTWGSNSFGQLGYKLAGSAARAGYSMTPRQVRGQLTDQTVVSIEAGYGHCAVVCETKRFFVWGFGEEGQLGLGRDRSETVPREVKVLRGLSTLSIALGKTHTAVIVARHNIQVSADERRRRHVERTREQVIAQEEAQERAAVRIQSQVRSRIAKKELSRRKQAKAVRDANERERLRLIMEDEKAKHDVELARVRAKKEAKRKRQAEAVAKLQAERDAEAAKRAAEEQAKADTIAAKKAAIEEDRQRRKARLQDAEATFIRQQTSERLDRLKEQEVAMKKMRTLDSQWKAAELQKERAARAKRLKEERAAAELERQRKLALEKFERNERIRERRERAAMAKAEAEQLSVEAQIEKKRRAAEKKKLREEGADATRPRRGGGVKLAERGEARAKLKAARRDAEARSAAAQASADPARRGRARSRPHIDTTGEQRSFDASKPAASTRDSAGGSAGSGSGSGGSGSDGDGVLSPAAAQVDARVRRASIASIAAVAAERDAVEEIARAAAEAEAEATAAAAATLAAMERSESGPQSPDTPRAAVQDVTVAAKVPAAGTDSVQPNALDLVVTATESDSAPMADTMGNDSGAEASAPRFASAARDDDRLRADAAELLEGSGPINAVDRRAIAKSESSGSLYGKGTPFPANTPQSHSKPPSGGRAGHAPAREPSSEDAGLGRVTPPSPGPGLAPTPPSAPSGMGMASGVLVVDRDDVILGGSSRKVSRVAGSRDPAASGRSLDLGGGSSLTGGLAMGRRSTNASRRKKADELDF